MQRESIYQQVTDAILAQLEQGVAPWQQPWKNGAIGLPRNATTQRPYQGVNVLILWLNAQAHAYGSQEWLTYRQAQAVGAQVRKGEKGCRVVFYKPLPIKEQLEDGSEMAKTIPLLRTFTVFNLAQCDGLARPTIQPGDFTPIEAAQAFLAKTGAVVEHGGNQAFYRPALDRIQLPEPGMFTSPEAYYATSLHEHVHWTGAKSRLDRETLHQYSTDTKIRAAEELIAELGAAFLGAALGLQGQLERHVSYLDTWRQALKEDSRAIFHAAAAAQKACDFLSGDAKADPQDLPDIQTEAA